MNSGRLKTIGYNLAFYGYGLFTWCYFGFLAFIQGSFFAHETEKEKLQLQIEQDRFWNLAKQPLPGYHHAFFPLRNGRQVHYISNRTNLPTKANLCVFVHGFPDTCMLWRHLLSEPSMASLDATVVCLDIPGFGGSDNIERYDSAILEALTEFIVGMRDLYTSDEADSDQRTFYVGHDWGCALGFRLATEAPALADRFILLNSPHASQDRYLVFPSTDCVLQIEVASANVQRITDSSAKIFKQFQIAPRKNFGCLIKSLKILRPLLHQLFLSGYFFAFNLNKTMVRICLAGANGAFLYGALRKQHGEHPELFNKMESMAASQGPGVNECNPRSGSDQNGVVWEKYGRTVQARARSRADAFYVPTGLYRDSPLTSPWSKSLQAVASLYDLESNATRSNSLARRRSVSSSSSVFPITRKGCIKAPVTALWGGRDFVMNRTVMMDGIGDFLTRDSEVINLPNTNHWIPVERESRSILARAIQLLVGSNTDAATYVFDDLKEEYPRIQLMAKR